MNIYEKIELNKELVLKIERSVSTAWARKKSTDEIVDEIVKAITDRDQALQLQQTGVIASCSNTYIGKEFVYASRITNCKTIFKVARTDDRYGQTILISENKNRYFLGEVIPHN